MRIKLDENLPADLADLLREESHDVTDVLGERLGGHSDASVLKAATDEHRILLTFDLDLADVRRYTPGTHAGIVVFRLYDQRWAALEGPIRRLLAHGTLETLAGALAIVDQTRTRIKRPKN